MKLKIFFPVLMFAALFTVGPKFSLEARHHSRVSFNLNPIFAAPAAVPVYHRQYIEQYPPVVEERIVVNNGGAPVRERIYAYPAPRAVYREVYAYPAAPRIYPGFSFGINFR